MNNKNMSTILVTGAAGFLGKRLTATLLKRGHSVVGTAHSESSIREFERIVPNGVNVPLYAIDVADCYYPIKRIIKDHKVDYVIHSAALKHVGICEKNPTRAVDVNVIGSKHIMTAALESDVKNIIGISTDKSVNPVCVYGMTKKLMEDMFLENGLGVFQGVNFLFSTGSVLDIWDKLMKENKTLLVNTKANRYFCLIDDVCDKIADSLNAKNRFTVDSCYLVSIQSLQKAFSKYHGYHNVSIYTPLDVEKCDEDLPLADIKIVKPDDDFVVELLKDYYNKYKNKTA